MKTKLNLIVSYCLIVNTARISRLETKLVTLGKESNNTREQSLLTAQTQQELYFEQVDILNDHYQQWYGRRFVEERHSILETIRPRAECLQNFRAALTRTQKYTDSFYRKRINWSASTLPFSLRFQPSTLTRRESVVRAFWNFSSILLGQQFVKQNCPTTRLCVLAESKIVSPLLTVCSSQIVDMMS